MHHNGIRLSMYTILRPQAVVLQHSEKASQAKYVNCVGCKGANKFVESVPRVPMSISLLQIKA